MALNSLFVWILHGEAEARAAGAQNQNLPQKTHLAIPATASSSSSSGHRHNAGDEPLFEVNMEDKEKDTDAYNEEDVEEKEGILRKLSHFMCILF
jgi:hypothetical protein